jgi:BolA protein
MTQISVQHQIEERLIQAFSPTYLKITNFSDKHAGHAGVAGNPSSETHFRIYITAPILQNLSRVAAHRLIHKELTSLINNPIHALEIRLKD